MSPADAAKLLELAPDATPEQIETRFQELRAKLEDKIAKAPTPGLKAKYRESLDEITQAFETLTLAADASALPVVQRQKTGTGERPAADARPQPAPGAEPSRPTPSRKSGSREFVIVAVIAIALLAGGGWWIMKVRAENEEKARLAAVAKAEAERLAEKKKQADAAEQERLEKLGATTRARIAELRIAWEAIEQENRTLERTVSDLKAEERSLSSNLKGETSPELRQTQAELSANSELAEWLRHQLLRHPAKVARVQGEELLSAKQINEAVAAIARAGEEQQRLENEFAATRRNLLTLTAPVSIRPELDNVKWTLTDAYGRVHRGEGPIDQRLLPIGPMRAEFSCDGFTARTQNVLVRRSQSVTLEPGFVPASVTMDSYPAGAEIWMGSTRIGVTPLPDHKFAPGEYIAEFRLKDYPNEKLMFKVEEGDKGRLEALLLRSDSGVPGFNFQYKADGADEAGQKFEVSVTAVMRGSPAEKAGIVAGDVIRAIVPTAGKPIDATRLGSTLAIHAALTGPPGEIRTLLLAKPGATATREVRFALISYLESAQPRNDRPYENTLGMKFVPVPGTAVLFSIWETRYQDFAAFVDATGYVVGDGMWSLRGGVWSQRGDNWRQPGFKQEPNQPAVGMAHADAIAFCQWLTKKERAEGRIGEQQSYRLPTNIEWDQAVGPTEFPWGETWPAPSAAGNYPGSEARDGDWDSNWLTLPGYTDKFARTAPVGSFAPNQYGLYDLGGNVFERVQDDEATCRGSAFNYGHDRASVGSRHRVNAPGRGFSIGFRIVLVTE